MSKELSLLRDKMGNRNSPQPLSYQNLVALRDTGVFLQRIWHADNNCSSRSCHRVWQSLTPLSFPAYLLVCKDCYSLFWRKFFLLKPHPSPHPFLSTVFVFLLGLHTPSLGSMLSVFRGEVSSTSLHSDQLGKKNKSEMLLLMYNLKKNVKFVALIFCNKN